MDGDPTGPPPGAPRLELLLGRIRSLSRARQLAGRELAEAQARSEGLRRHLEQLDERHAALEGLRQQKQETLRVARLRQEQVEAEGQRRRRLCLGQQQELEGAGQERGRLRDQCRAHRQDFWQQLGEMAEEHKRLQEAHALPRLEAELERLEQERRELLLRERRLLELEELLGPSGHVATRLVEQEEERARRQLAAELGRREALQRRRDRLVQELQLLLEAPAE